MSFFFAVLTPVKYECNLKDATVPLQNTKIFRDWEVDKEIVSNPHPRDLFSYSKEKQNN